MLKHRLAPWGLPLLFLLLSGDPAMADGPTLDVATLGPQVGEPVPAFTLSDQTGQEQTLESLTGPKGLVLVFFRSADW